MIQKRYTLKNMKKAIIVLFVLSLLSLDLTGQCFPDRHNTSWNDGWISCEQSENPNPERESSHWILYNLGYTYHLGQMHVWNVNAPEFLADGVSRAVIDISVDGQQWLEIGVFDFEPGPGSPEYEGFEGPDLSGFEAKYLLITAIDNFGGSCFGLGEIRVDVHGITSVPALAAGECLEVDVFPNPVQPDSKVRVTAPCNNGSVHIELRDITGRLVWSDSLQPADGQGVFSLDATYLAPGSYTWKATQQGVSRLGKVVKANRF